MDRQLFQVSIPLNNQTASQLRKHFNKPLSTMVLNQSLCNTINLCLSELINNFEEHSHPKPTEVTIKFGHNHRGWWLELLENGGSFDITRQQQKEKFNLFNLDEGGRGLYLVHNETDELVYRAKTATRPNITRLVWFEIFSVEKAKVLIIDDDPVQTEILHEYLHTDYNISIYNDPLKALAMCEQHSYDIIICDLLMPDIDGIQVRKQLNNLPLNALTPFVFMTSDSDVSNELNAAKLGIDDYLHKPFSKEEILAAIGRCIQKNRLLKHRLSDRIDAKVTNALTPRIPSHSNGWEMVIANRNTGKGGGDFLINKAEDGYFTGILTDIMGHDDSAKFFSHAFAGYMRGLVQVSQLNQQPEQLLNSLSQFAYEDELSSQITMTCCAFTLHQNGTACFASAGHPPPLHISKYKIHTLDVGGLIPGLVPEYEYQPYRCQFKVGTRLALLTDGLFESAANNRMRRLLQMAIEHEMQRTAELPLAQALAQVMQKFDVMTKGTPEDDVMLLMMEYQGHGQ